MRHPVFPRHEALYTVFVALFAAIVVISNLITIKLFRAPILGVALPCGILTYPFTFLIGDLVTEIYGPQRARFMVIIGVVISLASSLLLHLAIELPPHPGWASAYDSWGYATVDQYQHAVRSVFGMNVIAVGASLLAYFVSLYLDIAIYHGIRKITGEKALWLRNNVSTLVSQLIDTAIISYLLLYWGMGIDTWIVVEVAVASYVYKAAFALIDTPFLYAAVAAMKRLGGLSINSLEGSVGEEIPQEEAVVSA